MFICVFSHPYASVTKQYNLISAKGLCGSEGNRRSGVTPAMRHRLSGLSTYGLNGHRHGDEHPVYVLEGHGTLYLFLPFTLSVVGG